MTAGHKNLLIAGILVAMVLFIVALFICGLRYYLEYKKEKRKHEQQKQSILPGNGRAGNDEALLAPDTSGWHSDSFSTPAACKNMSKAAWVSQTGLHPAHNNLMSNDYAPQTYTNTYTNTSASHRYDPVGVWSDSQDSWKRPVIQPLRAPHINPDPHRDILPPKYFSSIYHQKPSHRYSADYHSQADSEDARAQSEVLIRKTDSGSDFARSPRYDWLRGAGNASYGRHSPMQGSAITYSTHRKRDKKNSKRPQSAGSQYIPPVYTINRVPRDHNKPVQEWFV